MNKARKPRATKPVQKPAECVVTLKLGTELYSGAGANFLEALQNLPKPTKITLHGLVTAQQESKTKTIRLSPVRLRRLFFSSPLFQAIHAKQFEIGLK